MALIKLSNREMVKLGEDLIKPRGKQREAIEAVAPARALIPTIERANAGLVASQVPAGSELATLTDQLAKVDGRHDDLVRAIDGRLEAEHYASTIDAMPERMTRLRGGLFASGRGIIQRSYMEEAGEVSLRAARVTEDDRKILRKLKTYEGRTLDELFEELQAAGSEIGMLEKRRQDLGAAGEVIIKNRAARFQWIRAVNALVAVLESEAVDPAPILGPIREAEATAERRGSVRAAAGDGGETGVDTDGNTDGTDGNGGDVELDPPVPDDDPSDAS